MIKYFIFFIVFNLYANTSELLDMKLKLATHWTATDKEIFKGDNISGAAGSWRNLVEFSIKEEKICFLYRIPFKEKVQGVLKSVTVSKNEDCMDHIDKGLIIWENLDELKASLNTRLTFKSGKKDVSYNVMNTNFPKQGYLYNPQILKNNHFEKEEPPWDEHSWKCLEVDDKCKVVFNKCSFCKGAQYEVLRSKCAIKRDRYCGQDRCGQNNFPACIRHLFSGNDFFRSGCFQDTDIGLCQKGLKTNCDKDKNVICY